MLPYYEYVNHMLRAYFARDEDSAQSEVEKTNRAACDRILRRTADKDREILMQVFARSDRSELGAAVRICAEQNKIAPRDVWRIIRTVSKEIARERGLI